MLKNIIVIKYNCNINIKTTVVLKTTLPFCVLFLMTFTAISQSKTNVKSYSQLVSMMQGSIANAKDLLKNDGFKFMENHIDDDGLMVNYFEIPNWTVIHPFFGKQNDSYFICLYKDKIVYVSFDFLPSKIAWGPSYGERSNSFLEELIEANCK